MYTDPRWVRWQRYKLFEFLSLLEKNVLPWFRPPSLHIHVFVKCFASTLVRFYSFLLDRFPVDRRPNFIKKNYHFCAFLMTRRKRNLHFWLYSRFTVCFCRPHAYNRWIFVCFRVYSCWQVAKPFKNNCFCPCANLANVKTLLPNEPIMQTQRKSVHPVRSAGNGRKLNLIG